jgi:hypothetical protein
MTMTGKKKKEKKGDFSITYKSINHLSENFQLYRITCSVITTLVLRKFKFYLSYKNTKMNFIFF